MRREWLIYLVLALVTMALFLPSVKHDFVNYDDQGYVTQNLHVQSGLTWDGVVWAFKSGEDSNWHPLTWLSLMLDYQIFGLKPGGYHFANVLLHTANTLLVFGVLLRMTGAVWRSAIVAALFGWHPMHVESVAWVAERKDVLCAFFWLLTMWAYTAYVKKPGTKNYLLSLLCFTLALLSKPMAVTLPFVLLLLDYWPLQRISNFKFQISNDTGDAARAQKGISFMRLLREKAPFFALTLGSCAVTYLVQSKSGAVASLDLIPVGSRIANLPVAYATYVLKLFWPVDLAILYPLPQTWPDWEVGGATLFVLGTSAVAVQLAKKLPALPVGWLWFLGTLVPVIGLVQVGSQAIADRYSYLPSIGLFVAAVWGMAALTSAWQSQKQMCSAVAGAALAACCWGTFVQLQYWQNGVTLFGHAIKVTENNGYAYTYLGDALIKAGNFQEGADDLSKAEQLQPRNPEVPARIGSAMMARGDVKSAITYYRRALELDPNLPGALNNLAWIFASNADPAIRNGAEAVQLGERACEATHYQTPLMVGTLAAAYAEAGRFKEAVDTAEKARQLAMAQGDTKTAQRNEELMQLYREGKAFHETPR
jgi:Tfp pilus assembly protein PilF